MLAAVKHAHRVKAYFYELLAAKELALLAADPSGPSDPSRRGQLEEVQLGECAARLGRALSKMSGPHQDFVAVFGTELDRCGLSPALAATAYAACHH